MRVVVDTNILVCAAKENDFDCLEVLTLIDLNKHRIVIDYEGRLLQEYEDNLKENELYRKWFKRINRLLEWSDGHLENTHKQALIYRGLHEPEDHVVVALAYHTDKCIVTKDSDFGIGDSDKAKEHLSAFSYLTEDLDIRVYDAGGATKCL